MTVRTDKVHHRPKVRRLPRSLGAMRWVADCDCGFWRPTTFWKAALIKALLHAEALR